MSKFRSLLNSARFGSACLLQRFLLLVSPQLRSEDGGDPQEDDFYQAGEGERSGPVGVACLLGVFTGSQLNYFFR